MSGRSAPVPPNPETARRAETVAPGGRAWPGEDEWRAGTAKHDALALGNFKINVHAPELWRNERFALRGPTAQPGCGDLCFVWSGSVDEARALIEATGGPLLVGPVERIGRRAGGTATGTSLYTRDPDGNLVELITYGG